VEGNHPGTKLSTGAEERGEAGLIKRPVRRGRPRDRVEARQRGSSPPEAETATGGDRRGKAPFWGAERGRGSSPPSPGVACPGGGQGTRVTLLASSGLSLRERARWSRQRPRAVSRRPEGGTARLCPLQVEVTSLTLTTGQGRRSGFAYKVFFVARRFLSWSFRPGLVEVRNARVVGGWRR
jgi:hypothetical protein